MKTNKEYNFRVGDYVETASGRVGHITSITRQSLNDDGDIFYQIKAKTTRNPEMSFNGTIEPLKALFNRIGQYDFTKPEQSKEIKKLPDGYGDGYVLYKGVTTVDGTVDNCAVSLGVLSNKINELVEAVNELRGNKNE